MWIVVLFYCVLILARKDLGLKCFGFLDFFFSAFGYKDEDSKTFISYVCIYIYIYICFMFLERNLFQAVNLSRLLGLV